MDTIETGKKGLFPAPEVLTWVKRFLQYLGYELIQHPQGQQNTPDFHARRQAANACYEVIGVVCPGLDEAPAALDKLRVVKNALGENPDYVLVFPPVSEYFMIEFMIGEQGKWYFSIKDDQFMVWLCNPDLETTTCLIGAPRDKMFEHYFVNAGKMISFDGFINMRLSQMIMAEEENEI